MGSHGSQQPGHKREESKVVGVRGKWVQFFGMFEAVCVLLPTYCTVCAFWFGMWK